MRVLSLLVPFFTIVQVALGSNVPRGDASIQGCHSNDHCIYPPHSVPSCKPFRPCTFTCKDGYEAWPSVGTPFLCKCDWPYKVCPNGKCARSCPSGHPYNKRDLFERQCKTGYTACGIPGRGAKSWECLNTQSNLESCGGCVIPLHPSAQVGRDCTAIENVYDVSCNRGKCVVHKCKPGYEISNTGDSCVQADSESPILLTAQLGFEHFRAGAL